MAIHPSPHKHTIVPLELNDDAHPNLRCKVSSPPLILLPGLLPFSPSHHAHMPSAPPSMPSTRRSAIWLFILLLSSLTFLRSLAPERTGSAIKHLIAKRNQRHGGNQIQVKGESG